jgi:uncharacterized repeat protein (TIGR02543 family)
MKKRIISLFLTLTLMTTMIPLNILAVWAETSGDTSYGDADNNGKVELLDVNLMERYIEGDTEATGKINITQADVNADGKINDTDVQMVKDYLVGNLDNLTPVLHTITFETNGGGKIDPIKVGEGNPYRGEIPAPAKDNFVFVKWVKDDGSDYYQAEDVITADMTLTAVYEELESKEQLNITSFSLDNQSPDVSFQVTGEFSNADEVKTNLSLLPKDGSEPVEVTVTANGSNQFTVTAATGFTEGASYELTLNEGLNFADKDEMFRTVYFSIEKEEVDHLKYNPDLIFIKDTEEMKYTVNGKTPVDVLESALLTNDTGTDPIQGSFSMSTRTLEVGDMVCIYENLSPEKRDYTQNDYEDDAVAYIKITGVGANNTYYFESLNESDAEEVLATPDSIPYQVAQLPTANGTVSKYDFDTYARSILGQSEAPEFNVGDFLIFYTEEFSEATEDTPVVYGQVTGVIGDNVSYKLIDKQAVEDYMGLFVTQKVKSDEILDNIDQQAFLNQVEQQAAESGFVEDATNQMIYAALQTDDLQQKLLNIGLTQDEIQQLSLTATPMAAGAGGGRVKFAIEQNPTVSADFMHGEHFDEGVGVVLDVSMILSVTKKVSSTKTSSLKIQLTAGFEQEVEVGIKANIEDRWKWYLFIPVLKGLDVTVSVDVQNYTYVSIGIKVYTVSDDVSKKKWTALSETITGQNAGPKTRQLVRDINKLGPKLQKLKSRGEDIEAGLEQLQEWIDQVPKITVDGKEYSFDELEKELGVQDVSTSFEEILNAENESDAKTGTEQLMDQYKQMLEQECDWIELYNQPLQSGEFWIAVVAIRIDLSLVISANVNIQIGADLEYQVGKRYNFWMHVLDGTSGSSEMDLIDERFAFQFYVMGTLGLKVGVKLELSVGLLSTSLASIGGNMELGAYLKLYGYFFYYFERFREANEDRWNETDEMMGALYLEFGIYLTVKFKAQVFFNALKYEPTLYDTEIPLLWAGVEQNVYGFSLEPDEDDVLFIKDRDNNSTNGITMELPETYRTMKRISLTSGEKSQAAYYGSNFIITFDDSRFSADAFGNINVDVPEGTQYLSCNMRIVWKSDKLTFSKYDIAITVPVVWTSLSETQLNEKFTASVKVGNDTDGYTTVWSGRYGRLDTFDLPTEEEILKFIDYDSYNAEDGTNLKYEVVGGYEDDITTGLSLTADTTYYFNVTPKVYTLTVTNVQHPNGSTEIRKYQAKYGETFDLSDLKTTGTDDDTTRTYTRFFNLTNPNEADEDKAAVDMNNMTVDMAFIEKYGSKPTITANYVDTSLIATYLLVGLGNSAPNEDEGIASGDLIDPTLDVPTVRIKFKSGETPSFAQIQDYVKQYGGSKAIILSVSPEIVPSTSSVTYTVMCEISQEEKPSHTLNFDSQGGSEVKAQNYPEGSMIFAPDEPTRTGYNFQGWYQEAACTTPFDFTMKMPNQDVTAYAKWKANTYNVHLSTAYASSSVSDFTVSYDGTYPTLPDLSNKDVEMSFKGWYTEESGKGTQITGGMTFNQAKDQTLYAYWTRKKELTASSFTSTSGSLPQHVTYNESPQTFGLKVLESGLSPDEFTIQYQIAGEELTTQAPTNAGSYLIYVSRPTDNEYLAVNNLQLSTEAAFVIDKAPTPTPPAPEISVSNWVVTIVNPLQGYPVLSYSLKSKDSVDSPDSEFGSIGGVYPRADDIESGKPITIDMNIDRFDGVVIGVSVRIDSRTNYSMSAWSEMTCAVLDGNGNVKQWLSADTSEDVSKLIQSAPAKPEQTPSLLYSSDSPLQTASASGIPSLFNRLFASNTAASQTTPMTFSAPKSGTTPTMTLSPEEVVLNRGKEFEVKLALDQDIDIWGIFAAVDYDPELLELVGYTAGDIFTDTQFTMQKDLSKNPYKFLATLDTIDLTSGLGNFIILRFKVRENAAEKEAVISLETLEVVNQDSQIEVSKGKDIRVAADDTAPVLKGIKDGGTYYGDTTVTVIDNNLASVTVNNETVTVTNGKFTLKPVQGPQTIVVTDKAGNSTTVTVTVNEPKPSIQTGDYNLIFLWVILLFVSGVSALGVTLYQRKKKRSQ